MGRRLRSESTSVHGIRFIAGLVALVLVAWPTRIRTDEAGDQEEPGARLGALIAEGAAASEGGCLQPCLAAFAEAIGLADRLAADPAVAYPALGVHVRVQLAETLRARSQHADAEAAAWDALDLAVSLDDLDAAGPPTRLVILSVIDRDADRQSLADLVVELDLVLGPLDAYRLHVSPPPEPVALMMEGMARELARAGEVELARESFAALVELDTARGAAWRGPADLGQLAWASLQAGDQRAAAWAQDLAEGGADTVDLKANRAAMAFEEGRLARSIELVRTAAEQAAEQEDRFRQAVLLGRLATLQGHAGDVDSAVKLYREAAILFDGMERPGDAVLDRARAALALARDGRLELALDELAGAIAPLGEDPRPPEVEDVVRRIDRLRLEDGALPREEAAVLLGRVERHLFDQERPEELLEVALLHVRWAIEDEAEVPAAVEAIEALQEQAGLTREGWQAPWARGLAASGAARIEAWREAAGRLEWSLTHPLPDDRVPGEPPVASPDPLRLHRPLIEELIGAGQHAEALDVAERARAIRRLALLPPGRSDPALEELRLQIRAVSFRGGERPPAEVRAELAGPLEELLASETQAIDGLPEGRRLLARIEGLGDWRPPEGTLVLACFEIGDLVHIVLLDSSGVTRVAEPDRGWLTRQVRSWRAGPRARKLRRRQAPGLGELGHLLGKIGGRLIEAERVLWVPAGPLAEVPLAAVPLPDGRPMVDVAEVLTFPSVREASLAQARPADRWLDVDRTTPEAGFGLEAGVVACFEVECLAGERSPAASALGLRQESRIGRATEPPPADGWLQPDEVLAAGWSPAAVVLPACAFEDPGAATTWASTWLLAGAGAVIWPLWEPDPDAEAVFRARLQAEIEAGAGVAEAFAEARARVRRRWKDPRDWAAWVLAAPLSR